jgi:pectinesterase
MKLLLPLIAAAVLAVLTVPASAAGPAPAQTAGKVRIVLAGDSTVTDDAGWGRGFADAMNDGVEVINLARGGRSSKSFRDEGWWKQVVEAKPNYVLIQFGHNDQPGKGPERETDPKTTFRQNLARYVDETRAIGAKPVLLTSLSRRRWDDNGIHVRSDLTAYAEATKAVATQEQVPLIDLHEHSIAVYESLRPAGCELLSPRDNKTGGTDHTHLNVVGSETFGPLIAWHLRRALPELSKEIRGYIPPEKRLATSQPTTVPTTGPAAEQLAARPEKPTPKGARTITVAADGSNGADFSTIQQAIAAVPDNNADRTTITIRAGVYTGPFVLPRAKQNVTFHGDGADKTILTYALNVTDPVPAGVPSKIHGTGTIVLADGFHARDLTFRNTSGDHGQAMALRVQGDRAVIRNCRLLGWQDTLLAHSNRQYFRDCYIEGRVDFIYGGSTAVFENCQIHSKEGGYITAASTPQENPFGFVFLDCKLTGDPEPQAFLGRPWRDFAAVAFIRCAIGAHIKPEGWHNWSKPEREKTSRYVEHQNTGPGADRSRRVSWSRELTAAEAATYTVPKILAGADGWNPTDDK